MSNRAISCAAFLIALAGLWACWCDVAMIWDGAYQFCCTLTSGVPFAYLSRFHSWIVWQPVAWMATWSDNLRLLKMAYGLPFCLAPLVSVLLSWWIVRRRASHLMIWSLFGAALAPLPGQIFMINDSIFQMHLFWPTFFATLVPITRPQAAIFGLLSLFQLSHPIGVGLCALTAAVALVWVWKKPSPTRQQLAWAIWLFLLAAGGIVKLLVWPDTYAAREASLGQAWMTFRWGVLWWPAAGLCSAWLAAGLVMQARRPTGRLSAEQLSLGALVLLSITGFCWIYWALDYTIWQTAANYRRWLVPMSFPFLLAAGWEAWHLSSDESSKAATDGRDRAGLAVAVVFLLVLGIQSSSWARLFQHLTTQVAASPTPWIHEDALSWTRETPMAHWGLGSQIYVTQGRSPHVALWTAEAAHATSETPPRIALSPFNYFAPTSLPADWFQWSTFLQATEKAPLLPFPGSIVDKP